MLRSFLSVVAAALLISVILLTPASSAEIGEATIPADGHRLWSVQDDRQFTLSYAIEAIDGSTFDVAVISEDDLASYLAGTPSGAVAGMGAEKVSSAAMEMELRPGTYYIVVERVGGAVEEATISYHIETSADENNGSSLAIVLGCGALVLMVTVVLFSLDLRTRRKG